MLTRLLPRRLKRAALTVLANDDPVGYLRMLRDAGIAATIVGEHVVLTPPNGQNYVTAARVTDALQVWPELAHAGTS